MMQQLSKKFKRWEVTKVVAIIYILLIATQSKSIYEWTIRLPNTETNQWLRSLALQIWHDAELLQLEKISFFVNNKVSKTYSTYTYSEIYQASLQYKKFLFDRDQVIGEKLPEVYTEASEIESEKALLIGDSNMMRLGHILATYLKTDLHLASVIRAKLATGLAREDVFNWPIATQHALKEGRFLKVYVMLGANDAQDIIENNIIATFGDEMWIQFYSDRVRKLLDSSCQYVNEVYWVGLPPMRDASLNKKTQVINKIFAREVNKSTCGLFIPTAPIFANTAGDYVDFIKTEQGLEKVRTADGIHISTLGNHLLARKIIKQKGLVSKKKNKEFQRVR